MQQMLTHVALMISFCGHVSVLFTYTNLHKHLFNRCLSIYPVLCTRLGLVRRQMLNK